MMMIIFQHFWVASLQLEREESIVWKLVYLGLQDRGKWRGWLSWLMAKLRINWTYFQNFHVSNFSRGHMCPSNAEKNGMCHEFPWSRFQLPFVGQFLCPFKESRS